MPRARSAGNGDGTIYPASGGGWIAALHVRGKRRYRRAKTRAEARRKLEQLKAEAAGRAPEQVRRLTVAQVLDERFSALELANTRPHTLEAYESCIRLHLKPGLGHLRAADLEPADVRKLFVTLREKGLSPATIAKLRSVLHGALQQALVEGLVPRNVAALVPSPKVERYQAVALSAEQVTRLLDVIRGHRHGVLWTVLLATGCRFGELAGLQWTEVDLARASITVQQIATRVPRAYRGEDDGPWELADTKTDRSRRALPLPAFAVAALTRQKIATAEARTAAGDRWVEHNLVFPNTLGGALREDHVLKLWHEVLAANDFPKMRLHDARHTAATLARALGADIRTLQEQLGHSSISMTADRYTHVVSDPLRASAERLDQLVSPRETAEESAS